MLERAWEGGFDVWVLPRHRKLRVSLYLTLRSSRSWATDFTIQARSVSAQCLSNDILIIQKSATRSQVCSCLDAQTQCRFLEMNRSIRVVWKSIYSGRKCLGHRGGMSSPCIGVPDAECLNLVVEAHFRGVAHLCSKELKAHKIPLMRAELGARAL